jgi:hypothetical protein
MNPTNAATTETLRNRTLYFETAEVGLLADVLDALSFAAEKAASDAVCLFPLLPLLLCISLSCNPPPCAQLTPLQEAITLEPCDDGLHIHNHYLGLLHASAFVPVLAAPTGGFATGAVSAPARQMLTDFSFTPGTPPLTLPLHPFATTVRYAAPRHSAQLAVGGAGMASGHDADSPHIVFAAAPGMPAALLMTVRPKSYPSSFSKPHSHSHS